MPRIRNQPVRVMSIITLIAPTTRAMIASFFSCGKTAPRFAERKVIGFSRQRERNSLQNERKIPAPPRIEGCQRAPQHGEIPRSWWQSRSRAICCRGIIATTRCNIRNNQRAIRARANRRRQTAQSASFPMEVPQSSVIYYGNTTTCPTMPKLSCRTHL